MIKFDKIMKSFVLGVIVALSTFVCAQAQDASVNPVYVINGKTVENFDGTQLVGKTIVSYRIHEGKHIISTLDAVSTPNDLESVYVCDDKVITEEEMLAIDPNRIKSISVIKQKGNPIFDRYTKNGCGVVIITLKK